jgi:hypothetical protein
VTSIAADALAAHIAILASPSLEGRGLASRGYDAAVEYATAQLKLAGVEPFGDTSTSYEQRVPLRRFANAKGEIEITRRDGSKITSRTFAAGVDGAIPAMATQSMSALIVFAGYGIGEPALRHDDFAGLEVRDRIVAVFAGVPAELHKDARFAKYARDGENRDDPKLERVQMLGAAALLVIEGPDFPMAASSIQVEEARAFASYDSDSERIPRIRVSREVARSILGAEGLAAALEGKRVAAATTATIRTTADETLHISRNVLGIIHGSNPELRDEAVVIGAHLDHHGIVDGAIHPGADDNASGVAALIEIARAFARAEIRPARTVVIAFWTGEEEGHFGSNYYVRNPRWPLDKTRAYLNLDMIGHPWLAEEIRKLVVDSKVPDPEAYLAKATPEVFVEPGVPRGVPALESALRRSAKGNALAMHIDWTDGMHGGSDYRGFARRGVPFIRFFGNFFPGYHTAQDVREALDPKQVERVARFAFASAWMLVNEQ